MSNSKISILQKKQRQQEIMLRIREGWSRKRISDWLMETYGITYQYSLNQISECFKQLVAANEGIVESARDMQVERLENLIVEALESNDRKTATKCLDMINKIYGLYSEKKDIEITGQPLVFKLD